MTGATTQTENEVKENNDEDNEEIKNEIKYQAKQSRNQMTTMLFKVFLKEKWLNPLYQSQEKEQTNL